MRREVARPWPRRPGPRETHVGGSHVRAGYILPAVTCMSCIRYFSSDYHQKWPRTGKCPGIFSDMCPLSPLTNEGFRGTYAYP